MRSCRPATGQYPASAVIPAPVCVNKPKCKDGEKGNAYKGLADWVYRPAIIPAQAAQFGTGQIRQSIDYFGFASWIPAFAGMTAGVDSSACLCK